MDRLIFDEPLAMKSDLIDNTCHDCGVDARNERYMVIDETWRQSGLGPHDGVLCVGCLETRLGRQLKYADFTWMPLNITARWTGSERLKDRLGAYWIFHRLRRFSDPLPLPKFEEHVLMHQGRLYAIDYDD
jgi:hypothetical protein